MKKMNVIITGATGMVGKGVLLECIKDERIENILLVSRRSNEIQHNKIKELLVDDMNKISLFQEELKGYDAAFYCMGMSAFRKSEEEYKRITYDLTLDFAMTALKANPQMQFIYVSGLGTDSTEKGRTMWARVKGKTENDILSLGFKNAYMFRPGFIEPKDGIKSSTPMYNTGIKILKPFISLIHKFAPGSITTTQRIGKVMINVMDKGYDKVHISNKDINVLAEQG